VEPLLARGLQRLAAAGWAPAPHLPPKPAAFYQTEVLVQEHDAFAQDKTRSPLPRNNFSNEFSSGDISFNNTSSAVLHALRQSGSLTQHGSQCNPAGAYGGVTVERMPFLSLDADDESTATGASANGADKGLAADRDNQNETAGAAADDIVAGVDKRVRVAIRSGLSQSTLFATATGLGAGMEVP